LGHSVELRTDIQIGHEAHVT